jgi:hypothetical protein
VLYHLTKKEYNMCIEVKSNVFVLELDGQTLELNFCDADDSVIAPADADFNSIDIENIQEKFCFQRGNEEFQFIKFSNTAGIAYRRIIRAVKQDIEIENLLETISLPKESELAANDKTFCFHAENTRIYERFIMPVSCDRTGSVKTFFELDEPISGTQWAGKGNLRKEVGRSPFQPFPVMIWGNHEHKKVLLDGTLTQKRLYRYYNVIDSKYFCYQAPKAIAGVIIPHGEELAGEWNYLEISENENLNYPYSGFIKALRNFGQKYTGELPANHSDMIWGSWNDGIFREIDQQSILDNADFVTTHFPTVKWVQIDDGYDEWDYSDNHDRIGIGVAASGEFFSREKFPNGPRYFTNEIKKRGLRPALWVGLAVAAARRPFTEHPEWFLEYRQCPKYRFFDISRKDVREFVRGAFKMFFEDWGFEGIKLDFWSYFFEDEQIELSEGTITGGEYRKWFLKNCREFMPKDGYLQTGCDIAMGNIHLAEHVDNYRYGIDIGHGNWNNFCTNAKWAAFCLNTHTGDIFVPNSDSIGYFPGLERYEAKTAINFCLITRTLLEIAGWLYRDPENSLLPFLKKACCCPKNGENVFFGNFNFKQSGNAPDIWYLKSPHFSIDEKNNLLPERTVAIFNWDDNCKPYELKQETLELNPAQNYLLKDFWSDEIIELPSGSKSKITLDGHHSRLFSIIDSSQNKILDSNTQINQVLFKKGVLSMETPLPAIPELTLNFQPAKIIVNGKETPVKLKII